MDGSGVKEIALQASKPQIVSLGTDVGVEPTQVLMAPSNWTQVKPNEPPAPNRLATGTLRSVVDYLHSNIDGLPMKEIMVRIKGPQLVVIEGKLEDERTQFRRREFLGATAKPCGFSFASFMDQERFIIGLQTCFEPTADLAELIQMVGGIMDSDVRETTDDGIKQEVNVSRGITLKRTPIKTPVSLAPFRTFRELHQPVSPFCVRVRPNDDRSEPPMCALFEADGGAWEIAAAADIQDWLFKALNDLQIEVALIQ